MIKITKFIVLFSILIVGTQSRGFYSRGDLASQTTTVEAAVAQTETTTNESTTEKILTEQPIQTTEALEELKHESKEEDDTKMPQTISLQSNLIASFGLGASEECQLKCDSIEECSFSLFNFDADFSLSQSTCFIYTMKPNIDINMANVSLYVKAGKVPEKKN